MNPGITSLVAELRVVAQDLRTLEHSANDPQDVLPAWCPPHAGDPALPAAARYDDVAQAAKAFSRSLPSDQRWSGDECIKEIRRAWSIVKGRPYVTCIQAVNTLYTSLSQAIDLGCFQDDNYATIRLRIKQEQRRCPDGGWIYSLSAYAASEVFGVSAPSSPVSEAIVGLWPGASLADVAERIADAIERAHVKPTHSEDFTPVSETVAETLGAVTARAVGTVFQLPRTERQTRILLALYDLDSRDVMSTDRMAKVMLNATPHEIESDYDVLCERGLVEYPFRYMFETRGNVEYADWKSHGVRLTHVGRQQAAKVAEADARIGALSGTAAARVRVEVYKLTTLCEERTVLALFTLPTRHSLRTAAELLRLMPADYGQTVEMVRAALDKLTEYCMVVSPRGRDHGYRLTPEGRRLAEQLKETPVFGVTPEAEAKASQEATQPQQLTRRAGGDAKSTATGRNGSALDAPEDGEEKAGCRRRRDHASVKNQGGRPRVSDAEARKRKELVDTWNQAKTSGIRQKDFANSENVSSKYLTKCINWHAQRRRRAN